MKKLLFLLFSSKERVLNNEIFVKCSKGFDKVLITTGTLRKTSQCLSKERKYPIYGHKKWGFNFQNFMIA